jgi:O-antigen/teichoic acid export membrane protein
MCLVSKFNGTMVSSQKILTAVRHNWWLNALGMALSFCATVVLVRTLTQDLYAQYAAVLAMVWLATLVFEGGANSGLTRYMAEAGQAGARGSFYRALQHRRWVIALTLSAVLIALGPVYAGLTGFTSLAEEPVLFVAIAGIVVASLTRALARCGLLALFETRNAILWEQVFVVCRAGLLAAIALLGGGLWHLCAGVLALSVIEAASTDLRLWGHIGQERQPLPAGFINKAQVFGLLTILDKACAGLGGGSLLLLVLAPFHPAAELALLALALDLTGKLISLTVMPMGNLVSPYLSRVSDDSAAQGRAVARVVKFSSLLYAFSIGAGVLLAPDFVPLVFGTDYAGAAGCALVLLAPLAFENWVRGACSPALLRAGRYRELACVNVIQAVVTLGTIWLVHREPLLTAAAAVVSARAAVSALNLILLARMVAPGTYRVPAQGALLAVLAAAPWFLVEPLPLPPAAQMILKGGMFALAYYVGLRWVVLRDADTLQLAHRLTGSGAFARLLLPPLPC